MAKINYDYCENEDLYNNKDIEDELLNIYKTGKDNLDLFYSITPIGEAIMKWYPFKKDLTILKVGGVLESIAGALCKKVRKKCEV